MSALKKRKDTETDRNRQSWSINTILFSLWLSIILSCMICIVGYSNTPGDTGMTPISFPEDSRIACDANLPTLIMFAHPRCPCTLASISELSRLMANCRGRLSAQVWFVKYDGTSQDWMDTGLWRAASEIPGVSVHRDDGGIEAHIFQAKTSGQTMLYGPNGRLLFHGGLTISRGHEGDNPGLDALESLLKGQTLAEAETPVFGCPLFNACTNHDCGGEILSYIKP